MSEEIYLKEGYSIYIDEPLNNYYKIVRREPFQFVTGEESPAIFSTVASGSQSDFKNIAVLEPDNEPLHLLQVLWGVKDVDPVKYYVKIPTGQNRFGIDLSKEIGFIDATESPWYKPNPLYQFWLKNDWIPSINCKNGSPVVITPQVWFKGMKYDILLITQQAAGAIVKKVVFGGVKNTP